MCLYLHISKFESFPLTGLWQNVKSLSFLQGVVIFLSPDSDLLHMYNFSQRNILKKQLHAQLPGISWFVSICSVSRLFWECLGVGGCSGRADGSLLSLVKRSGCSGWPFCWEGCRSACCLSAVLCGGIAPQIQHDQVLCFPCWFHFHLYLGRALELLKGTVGSNDINLFSFVVGTVATEIIRAGLWKISIQCHLQLPPEDATSPFPFLFNSALVSFPVQWGQRPWVCGRVTRALSCEEFHAGQQGPCSSSRVFERKVNIAGAAQGALQLLS